MDIQKRIDIASKASMFVYAASATILPICLVKISEELSLNLTQGGSLGFISSIEQFIVLILSCFVAAKFGKILILQAALIILSIGMYQFTKSTSYLMTTFLILIIGFGQGFLEALLSPLIEDVYPGDNGKKMNILHAFWPIGVCFSVLVFGELLTRGVSWRVLFIGLGVGVLLVSFIYPSSKKMNLPKSRTDFSHMGEILSKKRFWLLGLSLFFAGGAESAFAFWSASYIQLEFSAQPRLGALGAALFAVGMVIGRLLTSRLAHRYSLKKILIFSAFLGFVISSIFFLINDIRILFVFLFFIGLALACLWPSIQSYAGSIMEVDTTILMIFLSCFGIPGYSSATIIMGIIGDSSSLNRSFIIAPIYLLILSIILILEDKLLDTAILGDIFIA